MLFVGLGSVGAVSSAVGGYGIVCETGLLALLFALRKRKKKGLTKAQRKKLMMRYRRRFVDNVVMLHQRLHNKNRAIKINLVKSRIINKEKKDKDRLIMQTKPTNKEWRDKFNAPPRYSESRAREMRDRIRLNRIRAESRRRAIFDGSSKSDDSTINTINL